MEPDIRCEARAGRGRCSHPAEVRIRARRRGEGEHSANLCRGCSPAIIRAARDVGYEVAEEPVGALA
jgi:hypothetical protein